MSPRTARPPKTPTRTTIDGHRHYRLPTGETFPSVTTVLDVINKPALVGWAAKIVAEQAVEYLPRLVRESRTDRDGLLKFLKGRPYAERDQAADAGTAAHDIAEAHILGKPYSPPEPDTDLGKTVGHFMAWIDEWQPTFEASEATVVNRTIGYAGTLDALARIPHFGDRLYVCDWKTSKSGPYAEWALQIAAYAHAEELWVKGAKEAVPMPQIDGGLVLRIRPDMHAMHTIRDEQMSNLLDAFTHALRLSVWKKASEKAGPFNFAANIDVADRLAPTLTDEQRADTAPIPY